MTEDIMRKVRALLDRAESTQHEAEAESCREAAERLMIKYTIDAALLNADRKDNKERPTFYKATVPNPHGKQSITLAARIAEAFNCRLIFTSRPRNGEWSYTVYGFQSDLDIVWTLYQSLHLQMWNDLNKEVTEYPEYSSDVTFKRSFMESFASRAKQRIQVFYREEVADSGTGTDLVLRSRLDEVNDMVETENPNLKNDVSRSRYSWAGAMAGEDSANRADVTLADRKVNDQGAVPIGR